MQNAYYVLAYDGIVWLFQKGAKLCCKVYGRKWTTVPLMLTRHFTIKTALLLVPKQYFANKRISKRALYLLVVSILVRIRAVVGSQHYGQRNSRQYDELHGKI